MGEGTGILGQLGINANIFGTGIKGLIVNLGIFIVVGAILGFIVYTIYQKKLYCEKIQIFEEINGQTIPTKQYMAREMNIPNTSIKVFQIKENGMFLPRPTIQTGRNNWLFFIRDDHEWINIGITSLNKQLTEAGLKYNHVDMRYANASLKELIKTNYGEKNWWKEYGHLVILGGFLILSGIIFYLVAEQFTKASENFLQSVQVNADVMKAFMDKIETSGITKVN